MSAWQLPYTTNPADLGLSADGPARAYDVVRRFAERKEIPGGVAMVGSSRACLEPFACGVTGWEPEPRPVRKDTLYDCASLTKVVVTATLVLNLVDEGMLRLDDPVHLYVPEWIRASGRRFGRARGSIRAREKVNLWHLLTHTSGLPAWEPLFEADSVFEALCRTRLVQEPGRSVVYSCLGFILLGFVVERVTGETLAEQAHRRIFAPLGMADSCFAPPESLRDRIAPTEVVDGRVIHGVVHDENARALGGVSGNAGLFSTAPDLARFALAILRRGRGAPQILSDAAIDAATRCHTSGIPGEPRGLGWLLKAPAACPGGDLTHPQGFGHTGFTGTSLWIDPQRDLFAILLTNRVHPTRQNDAHYRFRPLFHNALFASHIP